VSFLSPNYDKLRRQTFALTHNWDLVLPTDLLGAIINLIPNDTIKAIANAMSPNIKCTSVSMPNTTLKTATAKVYGLRTTQIVDAEQSNSIQLVMFEDSIHLNYRLFAVWRDLGMNSAKTFSHLMRKWISLPRGCFLWLYTGSRTIPSMSFELFDVQPTNVVLSNPSNEGQFMTCTVDLKYSNYETL